ncbi:MAG: ABC transporter ATP-binding protein [Planctomycetota bacterium]
MPRPSGQSERFRRSFAVVKGRDLALEEELARKSLTRATAFRVLGYLKPEKWRLVEFLVLQVAGVVAWQVEIEILRKIIDYHLPNGLYTQALWLCGSMALIYYLIYRLAKNQIILGFRISQSVSARIRKQVFDHVQNLSMRFFDRTKAGRIMSRADSDVDTIEWPLVWGLLSFSDAILRFAFGLSLMLFHQWDLALVVLIPVPFLVWFTNIFRKKAMAAYRKVRESASTVTASLAEGISGARVIQAYSQGDRARGDFGILNNRHLSLVQRTAVIWGTYMPTIGLAYGAGLVLMFLFGVHWDVKIGLLVFFIMQLNNIYGPIQQLGDLYNMSLTAAASAERIFLLLDTEPEIVDADDAISLPPIKGQIEFKNVYFHYTPDFKGGPEDEGWILKDINFKIEPGQMLALVGPTGHGKSTVANLVARFYDVQRGQVLIDGHDVKKVTAPSLRSQMGVVLQDNFLFKGTVLDNLKYGNPDCTDDLVVEAAKMLGAHEVIMQLTDGYQTDVGERGSNLSLGVRQLICFTRAMVADPALLILDEATSAVDPATEAKLQRALEKLIRGRTTVVIAHRLSTIRSADLILVIQKGRIVERGDHGHLLNQDGLYATLHRNYTAA